MNIELFHPHHNILFIDKNAKTQRNNLSEVTKIFSKVIGLGSEPRKLVFRVGASNHCDLQLGSLDVLF